MNNTINKILEIWTGHQNFDYKYSALSALIGVVNLRESPELQVEIEKLNKVGPLLKSIDHLSRLINSIADKDKRIVIDIREPHRENPIAQELHINPVIHEAPTIDIAGFLEKLDHYEEQLRLLLPNVTMIIQAINEAEQ